MRSISRPKDRSAGRCAPIAGAASLAFTTSYTTRFPEYVEVRTAIPASVGYAVLRHFHAAAAMTMVATDSLTARARRARLQESRLLDPRRRYRSCSIRTRRRNSICRRPIFMTMGRVAVEKNIEAFLSLDLPGTKVVIGDGPAARRTRAQISASQISRREKGPGSDLASGRGRCVRLSEQDRHLRCRATGSAGLRHAGRGVSGDRPSRRDRRPSDRRTERRPAQRLPAARSACRAQRLPSICNRAFLGKQCASVHRQSQPHCSQAVRRGPPESWREEPPYAVNRNQSSQRVGLSWLKS